MFPRNMHLEFLEVSLPIDMISGALFVVYRVQIGDIEGLQLPGLQFPALFYQCMPS